MLKVVPIEREEAFHKGVDYFVELFIFYGILGSLGVYELKRGIEAGRHQKEHIDIMENRMLLREEESKQAFVELGDLRS